MSAVCESITSPSVVPGRRNADACVVVPAFNEARVIGDVLAGLVCAFQRIVCVDDGSTDNSADIAEAVGLPVVRHPSNMGAGAALQTGIDYALLRWPSTQYVISFDADGQHRVEDAVIMLDAARSSGAGVVLGSRFLRPCQGMPLRRRTLLKAGVLYTRATTHLRLTDTHCGLRVLRRDVAETLNLRQSGMAHASELLQVVARDGIAYAEVPVNVRYSGYSLRKGQRAVNGINILVDLALDRLRAAR